MDLPWGDERSKQFVTNSVFFIHSKNRFVELKRSFQVFDKKMNMSQSLCLNHPHHRFLYMIGHQFSRGNIRAECGPSTEPSMVPTWPYSRISVSAGTFLKGRRPKNGHLFVDFP